MSLKVKTARLSIFSNSFLILINLSAGLISGSVSIISEAVHTLMDLMASVIAFFSVKISENPPDPEHPYGHGKFENISGVLEALLIFAASFYIIYESIQKLLSPDEISPMGLGIGFFVMIISALVNWLVSRRLYKVAASEDSIALKADALHLSTHVYTSSGVAISLGLIYLSGWYFLDPVAAIVVAAFILKEAFEILRDAFLPLIDASLPADELETIRRTIKSQITEDMGYHNIRTRKAGPVKHIDFHLEIPGHISVERSHDICDKLETALHKKIKNASVTIHVEPSGYHDVNRDSAARN